MPTNNWNTSLYDQKHAFVFEYGKSLISLLDPQPGESILDLGCGTGHLTNTIAGSGASVVGLDSSQDFCRQMRQISLYLPPSTRYSPTQHCTGLLKLKRPYAVSLRP